MCCGSPKRRFPGSSTPPASSATRRPSPVRHRSRREPAISRRRSSVRGACARGSAKITFGTGGMLDVCLGPDRPVFKTRGAAGTFPIIAWRNAGHDTWGLEAIMLSAGTNVEWLRDDLGVLATSAESHEVAQQCTDTGGVVYVPALLGLGTPQWDYGARGTVLGLSRGTGRAGARARGARGHRPARGRPRGIGRSRCSSAHSHVARRRRDDSQPDVRAGARRRDPEAGRDLPRRGGDRRRRRVPRRASRSGSGRAKTTSRQPGFPATASSRGRRSTATAGGRRSAGRRAGSPTSPASTSS